MSRKIGKFFGVGVGPGDPSMLTLKAVEVIKSVDVIFEAVGKNSKESVSSKIVSSIDGVSAEKISLIFSMSKSINERKKMWVQNAKMVVETAKLGKDIAFVTIGDPLIYSTFTYLMKEVLKLIPNIRIETVPGITSFQYSSSKKNRAIVEDEESMLLLPAWKEEIIDMDLIPNVDTVVCLKTYKSRNRIIDILKDNGKKSIIYAERVGLENETISESLDDIKNRPIEYLSHLIASGKK